MLPSALVGCDSVFVGQTLEYLEGCYDITEGSGGELAADIESTSLFEHLAVDEEHGYVYNLSFSSRNLSDTEGRRLYASLREHFNKTMIEPGVIYHCGVKMPKLDTCIWISTHHRIWIATYPRLADTLHSRIVWVDMITLDAWEEIVEESKKWDEAHPGWNDAIDSGSDDSASLK